MEVTREVFDTETMMPMSRALTKVLVSHHCYTPKSVLYHAQIRLLHHPRPNTRHESTPPVDVLAFHDGKCKQGQLIIRINPNGNQHRPMYLPYR